MSQLSQCIALFATITVFNPTNNPRIVQSLDRGAIIFGVYFILLKHFTKHGLQLHQISVPEMTLVTLEGASCCHVNVELLVSQLWDGKFWPHIVCCYRVSVVKKV